MVRVSRGWYAHEKRSVISTRVCNHLTTIYSQEAGGAHVHFFHRAEDSVHARGNKGCHCRLILKAVITLCSSQAIAAIMADWRDDTQRVLLLRWAARALEACSMWHVVFIVKGRKMMFTIKFVTDRSAA